MTSGSQHFMLDLLALICLYFLFGYCQFQLLRTIYVCEISLASIPLSAKPLEDVGLSLVRFHIGCQQNSIRKEVELFLLVYLNF